MTEFLSILALFTAAPSADAGAPGATHAMHAAGLHERLSVRPATSRLNRPLADASFIRTSIGPAAAPPCSGEVCQPRVSVPGYEPHVTTTGKRTELAVSLLDRARIEPLASAVWLLAATGLRLDYTPRQLDNANPVDASHGGWGHMQLMLRWRLDAGNTPVWPVRHRG